MRFNLFLRQQFDHILFMKKTLQNSWNQGPTTNLMKKYMSQAVKIRVVFVI